MAAGLLIAFTLMGLGYLAIKVYGGVPGVAYRSVFVSVPTVGNLIPHDPVRIGGRRVGQVLSVDIGDDGRPQLELQLSPGTELTEGTRATIRANGLLGARYVLLQPRRSGEQLADGATIRGGSDSYTFGLPDLIEVLDERSRGGLATTVGALGRGMLGNGAPLNLALKDLGVAPAQFERVTRAVLERNGTAERLLPSLRSGLEPLDRNREAAGPFFDGARKTLGAIADEREALQSTLATAPAALRSATSGLRLGTPLVRSVRKLAVAGEDTLRPAPAGLRGLAALLRDGADPLRDAEQTVKTHLPETIAAARPALIATEPLVPRIKSTVDAARPTLDVVGRHACDFGSSAASLRSMTGWSQPSRGPLGPAMAFRLQAILPAGLEAVGIKDETGIFKRDGYSPPCAYGSKPYPQLLTQFSQASKKGSR